MKENRLLIANWKTYIQDLTTVKNKIEQVNNLLLGAHGVVICPPSIFLHVLVDGIKNPNIKVGAQDISTSESGTGEITASMQKGIGCSYAIIGHSEVRERYGENNDEVAIKVDIALKYGMVPVICIGENIEVRNSGDHLKFLIDQLIESLPQGAEQKFIIAYEPIWSIGTGIIPTPHQIEEVISTLKVIPGLKKHQFLYGGSVNESNIYDISKIKVLDGVLVGAASTNIAKLAKIYQVLNAL
ncbi:triose-phosphate isomerase family protein [Candidatus Bandiella euplotis]|uniref:Triosephosphate isomerase n=1 Tax=Candidatus Bandiella euplotis TaxID=1664265 RepID=A0ABZ0UPH5_9RICK|nr:triose-phosphate isomerase family protein [Candidatus Bandiella woodruffii]WPX97156.1 Triosephosphate isomerase [Candidatus Bandiella woodruffii]